VGFWGGEGQLLGRSFSIQAIQDDEARCCEVLHIGGHGLEGMGAHTAWNEAVEVDERTTHVLDEIGDGGNGGERVRPSVLSGACGHSPEEQQRQGDPGGRRALSELMSRRVVAMRVRPRVPPRCCQRARRFQGASKVQVSPTVAKNSTCGSGVRLLPMAASRMRLSRAR
jgi:hypothetical protein